MSANSIAIHNVMEVVSIRTDTYGTAPGYTDNLMVVTILHLKTEKGEMKVHFHHGQKLDGGQISNKTFKDFPVLEERFIRY